MTAQPEHTEDPVDTEAEILDLPARPDTAVVVHETQPAHSLTELMNLARVMATSRLVPRPLQGKAEDVLIVLLTSQELGLGYMQGVSGIHVIEGKPTMSAELMRALVFRAGHTIAIDVNDERAIATGRRKGDDTPSTFTFGIEQARLAGLIRAAGNWVKYPQAMLAARATSGLCRLLFPDVIAGVSYVPEELERITIDRTDQPPSAEPVAPSEDLEALLAEVAATTDLDALRSLDKTGHSALASLSERAQLRAATVARSAVLTEAAAAGADPETGEIKADGEDIVDAELVEDEPKREPVWGDPDYVEPPAPKATRGKSS